MKRRRGDLQSATSAAALWKVRRGSTLAPLWLAASQSRRSWWLLSVVGLGMLVVIVLFCSAPLYSTLIEDAQIRQALAATPSTDRNIDVQVVTSNISSTTARDIDRRVERLMHGQVGGFTSPVSTYLDLTNPLIFAGVDGHGLSVAYSDLGAGFVSISAYDYAQAASHMHIIAGRLPKDGAAGQLPEVLVTPITGLRPGQTITFAIDRFHFAPAATFTARVAGVWQPNEQNDPFWNGRSFQTFTITDKQPPIYPVLFTRAGFLATFGSVTPPIAMSLSYLSFTHLDALTASTTNNLLHSVQGLRQRLDGGLLGEDGIISVALATHLDALLAGLQRQLGTLALPLYVIAALVIGLALLFIVAMMGVLIEGQAGELATLKSRGASDAQLIGDFFAQGIILALAAAVVGLFVARILALALARVFIPTLAMVGDAAFASNAAPGAEMPSAAIGVTLCLAALLVAAWQATRRDVLSFHRERGRAIHLPFWQRYNLDVGLALLCLAGYLELSQFGGLDVRAQPGQASAAANGGPDPLLLAAPELLLLAGVLLALRLFPVLARLCTRLAARARGVAWLLAFAQVARGTERFSRMTLLLMLAVGLGIFALTYQGTLARNTTDRAAYMTGSDVRIQFNSNATDTGVPLQVEKYVSTLAGVRGVTPILRTEAKLPPDLGSVPVGLLGIDPATVGRVTQWQPAYANQPMETLLGGMREHIHGVNAGTANAPIWALVDTTMAATLGLKPGQSFTLTPTEGGIYTLSFVVGAVVNNFPTMYDASTGGYIVVDEADLITAMQQIGNAQIEGPSELWLRTADDAHDGTTLLHALENPDFSVVSATDRRTLEQQLAATPVTAGMNGLLLIGASIAVALALLGSVIQSASVARQRLTLFPILRALGAGDAQLLGVLLGQQAIVYAFGVLGGTLLGIILATATLPFLQFSNGLVDPVTLGVPPTVLVVEPHKLALFYAALLLTCGVALLLAMHHARRGNLGTALRFSED